MLTEDEIKRVARALESHAASEESNPGGNDDYWRDHARAAIAALPTREAECARALRNLVACCVTSYGSGWRCICGAVHVERERMTKGHWHETGCAVAAAIDALSASPPPSGWQ